MTSIRDIAEFESKAFAPVLPEECQVNPGVYGAELAFWLGQELARRGVPTSYPNQEDWGWFIEYIPETGSEFAVLCANVGGSKSRWCLALKRHARKMFGRDKPPFSEAEPLIAAIREALALAVEPEAITWEWGTEHAA